MPTLIRLSGCKITVYAGDHNPPHFHILANGGREAWVELSSLRVIWGSVPLSARKESLAWAAENAQRLARKWKELNP